MIFGVRQIVDDNPLGCGLKKIGVLRNLLDDEKELNIIDRQIVWILMWLHI